MTKATAKIRDSSLRGLIIGPGDIGYLSNPADAFQHLYYAPPT